jgi:hypothetical protein
MGALGTPISGFGTLPQKGNSGAIPVAPGGGTINTTAPVTGAVPVTGSPVAATQANPYAAPTSTVAPTSGVAPVATSGAIPVTGTSPTAQTNGINWTDGSNTVTGDFKDTYGAGTGTAISNVLSNLGTSTDSAVQALINNTNLAATKQYGNIKASEAAGGVTPNSSTAALAAGDFYSSVNAQLQQSISGMELDEENTLLSTLTNEGQQHGPDESGFDSFMNIVGDVGSVVGSVASAVTGIPGLGKLSGAFGYGPSGSSNDTSGMLADMG